MAKDIVVRFSHTRNPSGHDAGFWEGYSSFGRNGWAKTTGVIVSINRLEAEPTQFGEWRPSEVQMTPITSQNAPQALQLTLPTAVMQEIAFKFLLETGADPELLYEAVEGALVDDNGPQDLSRWLED